MPSETLVLSSFGYPSGERHRHQKHGCSASPEVRIYDVGAVPVFLVIIGFEQGSNSIAIPATETVS